MMLLKQSFAFLGLAVAISTSACGVDAKVESLMDPTQFNPQPVTAAVIEISESVYEPKENQLPIQSMSPDTQVLFFDFPAGTAGSFTLEEGSTFAAGCDDQLVTRVYQLNHAGLEMFLAMGETFVLTGEETGRLTVTVSGLSQCMGFSASFLVVKQ